MIPAQDDVIRKIQKLLSLGKSSNEAEASLAMARAQELLAKHNLDFAMVKDSVVEGGVNQPLPEKREKTKIDRSAKFQWQRDLWKAVAESNFCWYWTADIWEPRKKEMSSEEWNKKWWLEKKVHVKRHMVLGKQSNVVMVTAMGDYLMDTIERLCPYKGKERDSRSGLSFRRGMAETLSERVREKARKMQKESVPTESTALTIRDVAMAEFQANYDARYGEGAYARKLLSDSEWEAGREQREKEAEEARVKAELDWLEYLKNETPAQKLQREKKEERERLRQEREDEKAYYSWSHKRYQQAKRTDAVAYDAGRDAGKKVSLASQVDAGRARKERALT